MTGLLNFFLDRRTILAAFVLSPLLSGVSGSMTGGAGGWSLVEISIPVFAVLAWFTWQQQVLATWATILILLVNGSGFLYDGLTVLFGHRGGHPALIPVQVVAGAYLTWGALVLHRERRIED